MPLNVTQRVFKRVLDLNLNYSVFVLKKKNNFEFYFSTSINNGNKFPCEFMSAVSAHQQINNVLLSLERRKCFYLCLSHHTMMSNSCSQTCQFWSPTSEVAHQTGLCVCLCVCACGVCLTAEAHLLIAAVQPISESKKLRLIKCTYADILKKKKKNARNLNVQRKVWWNIRRKCKNKICLFFN